MPIKKNVMFDNLYIQTWKKLLVSFKMYTWFTKKKQQKIERNLKKKPKYLWK